MRIPELFDTGSPVFSFEFFQPKDEAAESSFRRTVSELKSLEPGFVTITYGAAGSGREKTIETAGSIRKELGLETASHLTCIAHTRAEIEGVLERIKAHGIENIVALRGDAPMDGSALPADQRELPYAADLVRFIRKQNGFAVAVAGYPETHPEAISPEDDIARLKEKVDAGSDWVITQLFFDNSDYFDLVEKARAAGITVPIVPGIMPVTNFKQLTRFTKMCGAKIPEAMRTDLEKIADDREAVIGYGVSHATEQCKDLLEKGAPGIHFYTLNKSRATRQVLEALRAA